MPVADARETGANAVIPRNGLRPREYPAACERTHRTKTHRRTRGGRKNDACFRACLPGIARWHRRCLSRRVRVRVTIQQSRAHSFQQYVAVESHGSLGRRVPYDDPVVGCLPIDIDFGACSERRC